MKNVIAVLIAFLVFETVAWAGPKDEATIIVRNNTNLLAAVIVDPPPTLPQNPTQQEFEQAGGRILNPGQEQSFKVRAGSHLVAAQLLDSNGVFVGSTAQQSFVLARSQTLRLSVTGTTNAAIGVVTP